MKKIAFILTMVLLVSCSTSNKQKEVVRELAKRDLAEKLQLPEGTKFSDENIEINETTAENGSLGVTFLIKITIKSQDEEGNEILKTHTMNYKKIGEDGLTPEDYELITFE